MADTRLKEVKTVVIRKALTQLSVPYSDSSGEGAVCLEFISMKYGGYEEANPASVTWRPLAVND